jgi:CheY-like chemotaxis protein
LQRAFVADLLKEEGLEVVECASAEAAALVFVSTGNELRALLADVNLAGNASGVQLAQLMCPAEVRATSRTTVASA